MPVDVMVYSELKEAIEAMVSVYVPPVDDGEGGQYWPGINWDFMPPNSMLLKPAGENYDPETGEIRSHDFSYILGDHLNTLPPELLEPENVGSAVANSSLAYAKAHSANAYSLDSCSTCIAVATSISQVGCAAAALGAAVLCGPAYLVCAAVVWLICNLVGIIVDVTVCFSLGYCSDS